MLQEALDFLRTRKKANLTMVAVNIIVFLVLSVLGNTENVVFMYNHGACAASAVQGGEYYRLFTAMFLHFGFIHLVYNMLCLIFVGDMLESAVGPGWYLFVYLLGGLFGNLVSVAAEILSGRNVVSAGASGAVFAVIAAVFGMMVKRRRNVPQNLLRRVGLMTVLMLLQGFTQQGTDNAAHVGGAVFGFVFGLVYISRNTGKRNNRKGVTRL